MKFSQRGIITFVFDDGYESILNNVVPILDKYNMPGVFAVAVNGAKIAATEKRNITPWNEWLRIKERGHEIASHTANHSDLTKINTDELTKELSESQKTLSASTLVYPGGAYSDSVVAETKKYYGAGRTVERGFESIVPADPFRLKTFNFSKRNFSLFMANMWAIRAWMTNSWLIETYHLVGDTDKTIMHNVSLQDFEAHVRFVSHLPIKVRTIQAVIKKI